ncbi:MAG: hypothetical protein E4H41_09125 [Gemmatimonadales bacterium]|nr:MAG: hypothetical protein E4H41_09125 [Gemmatimonadales bacterium]
MRSAAPQSVPVRRPLRATRRRGSGRSARPAQAPWFRWPRRRGRQPRDATTRGRGQEGDGGSRHPAIRRGGREASS